MFSHLFFFTGMYFQIRDFVLTCPECQRNRIKKSEVRLELVGNPSFLVTNFKLLSVMFYWCAFLLSHTFSLTLSCSFSLVFWKCRLTCYIPITSYNSPFSLVLLRVPHRGWLAGDVSQRPWRHTVLTCWASWGVSGRRGCSVTLRYGQAGDPSRPTGLSWQLSAITFRKSSRKWTQTWKLT